MRRWIEDDTGSFHNYLPRGCRICRTGGSLVLFVTGQCQRGCFYCPLSVKRRGSLDIMANEARVETLEDILKEAKAIGALGTGITGGEPLMILDSVLEAMELLKREFGARHHIHLYTGLLPDSSTLGALKEGGLDEIRFHPQLPTLDTSPLTRTLSRAMDHGLQAGVEIPSIGFFPEIAEAVRITGAFLNLNELEFSETNSLQLMEKGFMACEDSSGAAGGLEVARKYKETGIRLHYCTSIFKDAVQLRERLKRRARRCKRSFDQVTEDGTLLYGVVEGGDIAGAEGFLVENQVPPELYSVFRDRVEMAPGVLVEISPDLRPMGYTLILIERYPMEGGLIVERIPL